MTESATAELPLVTAAVLAYNRRDALAITLDKLLSELDYPAERLEILVVDNASTDGTAEMMRERFPQVTLLVNEENTGIAGWNRAFEAGRGEWFLVLDDDCYVEGDALRRGVELARDRGADLVSYSVDSLDPERPFSEHYRTGFLSFWGCSVLISARAIREVGMFDPGLFIWAHELDYAIRLLDRGLTHAALPDVASMHMKEVPGFSAFMNQRNRRNFGYLATKHLQPRDAAAAVTNLLVRALAETAANRQMANGILPVITGAWAGLGVRSPVRPAVSSLYRRNYLDFASHLRFVRGPVERWRDRRDPSRPPAIYARQHAYWDGRPQLYPRERAALRVPIGDR